VITNKKRNSMLVAMLGCGAASLLGACSEDSTPGVDAGGSDADLTKNDSAPVATGPVTLFDFPISAQGWYYNNYQGMGDGGPTTPINLASNAVTVTGARPTIEWDGTVGAPAGSLKLTVNFTGFDQNVLANVQFKPTLQDWTNKLVTLQIKLDPGFEMLYTGGMQLFAQDETWAGTYQWKNWPFDNEWYTYELDMTMAGMNTAGVVQFGIQLISGTAAGATLDDQGNPVFTPTTVTAYIDNIVVQ